VILPILATLSDIADIAVLSEPSTIVTRSYCPCVQRIPASFAAFLKAFSVCSRSHGPHPEAPFAKAKGLEGCSGGRLRRRLRLLDSSFEAPSGHLRTRAGAFETGSQPFSSHLLCSSLISEMGERDVCRHVVVPPYSCRESQDSHSACARPANSNTYAEIKTSDVIALTLIYVVRGRSSQRPDKLAIYTRPSA
jgi:hypothetical protein